MKYLVLGILATAIFSIVPFVLLVDSIYTNYLCCRQIRACNPILDMYMWYDPIFDFRTDVCTLICDPNMENLWSLYETMLFRIDILIPEKERTPLEPEECLLMREEGARYLPDECYRGGGWHAKRPIILQQAIDSNLL